MLYIMNSEGAIKSVPSRVNQGSVNVNEIILLAPFPSDTTATLAIELPNKIKIEPRLMTNVDFATDFIKDADGRYFNAWRYVLPGALTQYAGTARLTFYLNTSDGVLPSDECTMTINKTTPYLMETADESDYTTIGAHLSAAQTAAEVAEGYAAGISRAEGVEPRSPYYQNNAKYYKEQAEGLALGTQNGNAVDSTSPYYENNAKYYADRSEEFASDARECAEALKVDRVTDITLQYDNKNHIIKVGLKGILADGTEGTIGTLKEFDLPLESVVVDGEYDKDTKAVVLTLQGGSTVEFSVADLVSGLVSQTDFDKAMGDTIQKAYLKENIIALHKAASEGYAFGKTLIGVEGEGLTKFEATYKIKPCTLVARAGDGRFYVESPKDAEDAANKKYVDDHDISGISVDASDKSKGIYNIKLTRGNGTTINAEIDLPLEAIQIASIDDCVIDGVRKLIVNFQDKSIEPLVVTLDDIFTGIEGVLADKLDKLASMYVDSGGFLRIYEMSNGAKTGNYMRFRGNTLESYYRSSTAEVKTNYTHNGPEIFYKKLGSDGSVQESWTVKYHYNCIKVYDPYGNYNEFSIPLYSSSSPLATQQHVRDNYASLTDFTKLSSKVDDFQKRTGNWYDADEMSAGIRLFMGRMYLCTGPGLNLLDEYGNVIYDNNGDAISIGNAKALAIILPNTVDTRGKAYRCKAIWTSESFLGGSINAKDFTLADSATGIKVTATGGTTIWSM